MHRCTVNNYTKECLDVPEEDHDIKEKLQKYFIGEESVRKAKLKCGLDHYSNSSDF